MVIDVVHEHEGFINKFEGDAALAIWGAPVETQDLWTCSLRAARTLRRRLVEEVPDLRASIGVSTGRAVAGNVGTPERYEYTVIGDPVNEAARLTAAAKRTDRLVLANCALVAGADPAEAAALGGARPDHRAGTQRGDPRGRAARLRPPGGEVLRPSPDGGRPPRRRTVAPPATTVVDATARRNPMDRSRTTLAALTAAATLGTTAVVLLGTAPAQAGGDYRVARTGSCSGSAVWKLKAKADDGRIEVEYEVDSNRAGQVWDDRLRRDGHLVWSGSRTTRGTSGSFTVERRIGNSAGDDVIVGRATRGDQVCRGRVVFARDRPRDPPVRHPARGLP